MPYKVILNNIDPRLGADEIRAAWGLLDGGGVARFRCAVRAYRAYSTAQANRQTVIQFKGRYAANVREDVKRVHTELLLDLGRIAAGKDVSRCPGRVSPTCSARSIRPLPSFGRGPRPLRRHRRPRWRSQSRASRHRSA